MTAMQWGPPPTNAEVIAHNERQGHWLARSRATTDDPNEAWLFEGVAKFFWGGGDKGRVWSKDPNARPPETEINGFPADTTSTVGTVGTVGTVSEWQFAPLAVDGQPVARITGPEAEEVFWQVRVQWLDMHGLCFVCRARCARRTKTAPGEFLRIHKRCEPRPDKATT